MGKKPAKNLLDLVPLQKYPANTKEDGTVEVLVPRYWENFIGRLFSRFIKSTPFRIHLDQVGTRIWLLCDGRKTVQEIGQILHREFGSEIEPVYERLGLFFKMMENQRLIDWKPQGPA
jgi:hypothetical protein